MSREGPRRPSRTRGSDAEDAHRGSSSTGGQPSLSTETVYQGRRDQTAPVGEEVEVTVDGEPLGKRYDLLSASPSGFEHGYGGSGPAQLAIAILAHAYDDEFAGDNYQQFKRDVVSELPEESWTLTKRDLDAWRREMVDDA
jgi:hypothetical protein